jgi:glycosyltransferase involved in cell wall biosynthesis
MSDGSISVVVPCLNEEDRIAPSLTRILRSLPLTGRDWDVLVIDDGSTDGTRDAVLRAANGDDRVRVARYEENHGKGWAFRQGFRDSSGDLVLLCDADLSGPIEELGTLLENFDDVDLAVGSRAIDGSVIAVAQGGGRQIAGKIFRALVRGLKLSSVRDTQCGFKLFRRSTTAAVIEEVQAMGFAFDVELLMRAEVAGLEISERPITWSHVDGSKLGVGAGGLRAVLDLAPVWLRKRRLVKDQRRSQ